MGYKLHQILAAGVLILLMLGLGGATAREQSEPDLDAIDRYIEEQMSANSLPGLALAITRGDEVLYLKGFSTSRVTVPRETTSR